MTTTAPFDNTQRDRFFRTMVLMGSSLALGCGGISNDDTPREGTDDLEANGGSGGSANAAAGTGGTSTKAGSGGTASAPATGGTTSAAGSGGTRSGTGGATTAGTGGSGGSAGTATTRSCPDEQHTCTAFSCSNDLWNQEGRCYCDFSRPVTPADCEAGDTFVCRPTLTDPETGAVLAQPTRVDCTCAPTGDTCSLTCREAWSEFADGYFCLEPPELSVSPVLCGCSFVYLK